MTAQPKTDIATREEYESPANEARPAHGDGGLLAVIERVALNPDVDIARMEALLKMRAEEEDRQRRIEREDREDQARREYLTAMSMVQAEIKPILRNKKNDHTKSLYADLASIERVVTPILTSNGFSTETAPVKCDVAGHIRVRLTISHSGGHERSYEDDFPLDGAGSKGNTNKTDIQAKGQGKTRRTYLLKLAGEIITGQPAESYSNSNMDRGHEMEPEARRYYEFLTDTEVRQVGFVTNGPKGCSPDGLVGDAGMYEAKSKAPHILIEALLKDEFPPEHKAQCQGALWVCEREWIDLHCHWPGVPLFIKRAGRDEKYIAGLAAAVSAFNDELAETVAKVRALGGQEMAA